MRRRAIVTLAASCLLAACAHQSPTAMPGMAWSLHYAQGEGTKLTFGQPQSDNVMLMMTCAPRSGDILVSLTASQADAVIELTSRGTTGRYSGEAVPSMGGTLIEAAAKASDPTLQRFAATGDIAVKEAGRRAQLPVRAVERRDIARFFESCET